MATCVPHEADVESELLDACEKDSGPWYQPTEVERDLLAPCAGSAVTKLISEKRIVPLATMVSE